MQELLAWLAKPATTVTVLGPALGFALAFALHTPWRARLKLLALMALACAPLALATSSWAFDDSGLGGLRILPVVAWPISFLIVIRRVDLRRDWVAAAWAVWSSTLVADALGAWMAYGEPHYDAPAWFSGIGGYGWADGLVLQPVMMTLGLLAVQLLLRWRWMQVVLGARDRHAPKLGA